MIYKLFRNVRMIYLKSFSNSIVNFVFYIVIRYDKKFVHIIL